MVDPETGDECTTNDFRFTWSRQSGSGEPRKVVPKTYKGTRYTSILAVGIITIFTVTFAEAMLWLEGKRALELGAEIRGQRSR